MLVDAGVAYQTIKCLSVSSSVADKDLTSEVGLESLETDDGGCGMAE